MNTKDLTLLFVGVGIVLIAYSMKKQGFEGFQSPADPTMGAPMPMGQPPMPMGQPPMPMGQPPMPMGQPPMPMGQPPMPMGQPPMPPMAQPPAPMPVPPMPPMITQPQPPAMQPNQQQLMDIAAKVQKMSSEQSAISAQLQQMTQSFAKEGFQSHQNPYNAASPGDRQSMEFRLGKKSMVNNVIQYE